MTNSDEDAILDPSTAPPTRYTPDRRRLSLNIRASEYLELEELARLTHSPTVVAAIVKSVALARSIFNVAHPEVHFAHLDPDKRPLPAYWTLNTPQPDGTEKTHRLVIW